MTAAGDLASFHSGHLVGTDAKRNRRGRRFAVLRHEPELEIAARHLSAHALDRLPVHDERDRPILDDRSQGIHVRGASLDEVINRGLPNPGTFVTSQLLEPGTAIGPNQRLPQIRIVRGKERDTNSRTELRRVRGVGHFHTEISLRGGEGFIEPRPRTASIGRRGRKTWLLAPLERGHSSRRKPILPHRR